MVAAPGRRRRGQRSRNGAAWTIGSPLTGAPSGRIEHTAVWTGDRMIIWGGLAKETGATVFLSVAGTPGALCLERAIAC